MENKKLALIKSVIDKEIENHPSPVSGWLKGIVKVAEEGDVTIDYMVRKEMCNVNNILQGGIMTAIIDDVMGMAVFTLMGDHHFSSINLNVDFLYPAKPEETITGKCRVVKDGKTIIYAECAVYNKEGKLLAKGASNLIKLYS